MRKAHQIPPYDCLPNQGFCLFVTGHFTTACFTLPICQLKLHIWSDSGKRKLHKLLAKMGISLSQSKQTYTHMDMDIKRGLRQKLLKIAPMYGLEGLVPREANHGAREGWGFVRCWGWKACLSAIDVGTVIGAILEVGDMDPKTHASEVARRWPQTQTILEPTLLEIKTARPMLW